MKEKQLVQVINERLILGQKKHDIFLSLSPQVEDTERLGWLISHSPYPELREKYKAQTMFLSLLCFLYPFLDLLESFKFTELCHSQKIFYLKPLLFILIFWKYAIDNLKFRPISSYIISALGCFFSIGTLFVIISKREITDAILIQLCADLLLFLVGLWVLKHLAPAGLLLHIKIPRDNNGNIFFD
ncbi:hypothetical protein [Desulforegula conservatrix]|uniref:hypothetical protein n=1 Tax=Desulforegula conservatrix TaxID=153026 RepID=UPI0004846F21|nr:hypothetical protein [Desulforegula conservatrix]